MAAGQAHKAIPSVASNLKTDLPAIKLGEPRQ